MPDLVYYRRRADEYRTLAAKAANQKEREGLLSVATLLETLGQSEAERHEAQQQPRC